MSRLSKLVAGAFAIACMASVSMASTITYTLSLNDDGIGDHLPGTFAVYATSSNDNFGIDAVQFTITGATFIENDLPNVTYTKAKNPTVVSGFSLFNSGTSANVTAAQDTVDSPTGYIVAGFGQTGGSLLTVPSGLASGYVLHDDLTNDNTGVPSVYNASLLVADGTFTVGKNPSFAAPFGGAVFASNSSGVNPANLTIDNSPQIVTQVIGGGSTPEPASLGVLALGAVALLARRRKVA